MEGEALNPLPEGPPAILERIVLFLIPPAARESVAGELCEMYVSPGQYARAALRAVPFIVLSQVRRHANFPLLALQGLLLFSWFSGMGGSVVQAGGGTLAILLAFAVREAYR